MSIKASISIPRQATQVMRLVTQMRLSAAGRRDSSQKSKLEETAGIGEREPTLNSRHQHSDLIVRYSRYVTLRLANGGWTKDLIAVGRISASTKKPPLIERPTTDLWERSGNHAGKRKYFVGAQWEYKPPIAPQNDKWPSFLDWAICAK